MTKQSDFKKRVRARMAKTGERFSAARARMLARPVCSCGKRYEAAEWFDSHFFLPPHDYRRGYQRFCLGCWLGVGGNDC